MEISLKRQVFDKDKFDKTIDTQFSELKFSPEIFNFDVNLATVEDFFILYNKFFYIIPKEGEINSHEFLIKESSEYINYQSNNEEIQALLEEITSLREENLQLRQDQTELISQFGKNIRTIK